MPRERQLKVGDKGTVINGYIEQVLDTTSVLVSYNYASVSGPDGYNHVRISSETILIICDTIGMIDKREFLSKQKFEIVGTTKLFDLNSGSKTILRLEAYTENK